MFRRMSLSVGKVGTAGRSCHHRNDQRYLQPWVMLSMRTRRTNAAGFFRAIRLIGAKPARYLFRMVIFMLDRYRGVTTIGEQLVYRHNS